MGLRDDGGGRPRGGRPWPDGERRPRPRPGRRRRRHLPPGLRRRGQHDAVVLHHHLFDLPHRPRFDRYWRAAWDGYRSYNLAVADVGGGAGGRGRDRAGAGLPLLAPGPDAGGAPARPAHGALPAHALRRPCHVARAARRRHGGAARRHGRLRRLRLPLPQAGRRVRRLLRRRGRPAPPHVRRAARARRRGARGGGGRAGRRGGGGCAARRGGRSPHRGAGRPDGAVEEHRAGDARLRGAARRAPRVAAARWCTWRSAYPSRQGLAEYLAYSADVVHTAERINHAFGTAADGWMPILLSVDADPAPSTTTGAPSPP